MLTKVPCPDRCAASFRADSLGNKIGTIRDLIDQMARTRLDASFLISPGTGRVLTFQGLHEQAGFLSAQLREAGLEHGDKVAFLLTNGLFTAQLFLGAMYGGFVSVPLNVDAGVPQLSYMLDHCDAKVGFRRRRVPSINSGGEGPDGAERPGDSGRRGWLLWGGRNISSGNTTDGP